MSGAKGVVSAVVSIRNTKYMPNSPDSPPPPPASNAADLERPLSAAEKSLVAAARDKAFVLYEGRVTPHRSCGIALAETFNLPSPPYQSLRRGGITGEGECGAIKAGELVLGELLGDPDPTAGVTPALRAAAGHYRRAWQERVDRGPGGEGGCTICNTLTEPFGDFASIERQRFCTNIAATVAEIVAAILVRSGVAFAITPIEPEESDVENAPS